MGRRTLELRIDAEPGERLDRALARAFEEASRPAGRRAVRRLIEQESVLVDGARVDRSSAPLRAGSHVLTVRADEALIPTQATSETRPLFGDDAILALDDHRIVVAKPAGLPTDPTRDPRRDSVLAMLARSLDARGLAPDGLRAVHRLDRDTSGVLLVARTRRAAAELGETFRERLARKTYLALAVHEADGPDWPARGGIAPAPAGGHGDWVVGEERLVDAPIGRLAPGPGDTAWGVVASGGKPARTRILRRAAAERASLFEAHPETGRTHQVRIHLRHAGFPIAGDRTYGAGPPPAPRVMLHAARLEVRDEAWEAPVPTDFSAWASEWGVELGD